MYGEDDGGDLMALVRSCSSLAKGKGIDETPPPAPDPLLYLPPPPPPPPPFPIGMEESLLTPPPPPPPFPMGMEESLLTPSPPPPPFPMGMEESLPTIFPDLFATNQMEFGDWEEICMPFQHPPQLQPPQSDDPMPLYHLPQLQPPESHLMLLHHPQQLQPLQCHSQLQQQLQPPQSHSQLQEGFFQSLLVAASAAQPPLKQTKKPQPTTGLSLRRKNDKNKVVNLSADIRVADDHWSWRKYGRKSIKGNSFPRSYYRCSFNKCPARKTVEKSPWDPEMFAISYIGEHSHPAPIYRNYPTGTICNQYCVSSSGDNKADSAAGTSSGQSPMTPLAISPSMEEDGEESWLGILDMDTLGDDELPFLGDNDGISFEDNDGGAAAGGDLGGAT